MENFHVLNGDGLAVELNKTSLGHLSIVCRECLIEGPVMAKNLSEFWKLRASFIADTYKITLNKYFINTKQELEVLLNLPKDAQIYLWFENDLFCQANMWFILSLLEGQQPISVFRVFPIIHNVGQKWLGFGISNSEDLLEAFEKRVKFSETDLQLGRSLWYAYQQNDHHRLKILAKEKSKCFSDLEEVIQAHIDRFTLNGDPGRPERTIQAIIKGGAKEFQEIFSAFSEREGVYGFGDAQVKNLLSMPGLGLSE